MVADCLPTLSDTHSELGIFGFLGISKLKERVVGPPSDDEGNGQCNKAGDPGPTLDELGVLVIRKAATWADAS